MATKRDRTLGVFPFSGFGDFSRLFSVVRSHALNSIIILCLITTFPAWTLAYFTPSMQLEFFWAGCFVPFCSVVAYFILLFRDPDRLQSERHQLDVRKMGLLADDRVQETSRGQVIEGTAVHVPEPAPVAQS